MVATTESFDMGYVGDDERRIRVLIIEDEKELLNDMADVLQMENFDVATAHDGANGIVAALSNHPDIILCDIMMPRLDGYQVLKALRAHEDTRLVPFIFMTAKTDRSDMRVGMQLGADDYITKPFAYDEMLNAIEAQMEKARAITNLQQQKFEQIRDLVTRFLPHEFRTPLTTILGYSEMMLQDATSRDDHSDAARASYILEAGKKLHRIVENYLLFTELQALNLDTASIAEQLLQSQYDWSFDLREECQTLADKMERGSDLLCMLQDTSGPLPQPVLMKIANELLRNAFAFSTKGTPVELYVGYDEMGNYVISVKDQGIGLSQQEIRQIGAYIQFNRSYYEQQGVGLGLAIVQHLTHMFNGRLHILSEPGTGTLVTCTFVKSI